MSEETQIQPAVEEQKPAADVKPNNIEAIEAKKLEALAEAKKAKDEARELKRKLEAIEQEKLESQGKYADINKSLKDKLAEYESQLSNTKKTYAYNAVTSVIKQKAAEMGAVNTEKVLKLMDKSDMELITVDDNFNVDMSTVVSVLEKMKKDNEDIGLFKRNTPPVKDVNPNPGHFNGVKDTGTKGKSLAELKEQFINLSLNR
jgi:phenylalanyl-tRNA synthetase alpha subunit